MARSPQRSPFVAWTASARWPGLDGLRCLCIVPVVWHHATPRPLPGLLGRGPLGVDLFFVVSGFLITTLLCREREVHGRVRLRAFYARRALRIFPLYYLVLGAFVAHAIWLRDAGAPRDHFLANAVHYATYTANWFVDFDVGHPVVFAFAWSLATEEQFYLFWPPLLRVTRGLAVPVAAVAIAIGVDQAAERGLFTAWLPAGTAVRIVTSFATPIGLGALLAMLLRTPRGFAILHPVLARRSSAPAALALLAVAVAAADHVRLFAIQLAMAGLVGACAIRDDHGLRWLTGAPLARRVGLASYGVYLVHVPILVATRRLGGSLGVAPPTWVVFAIGLTASTLLATLLAKTVERPFTTLRERLRVVPVPRATEPARVPRPTQDCRLDETRLTLTR